MNTGRAIAFAVCAHFLWTPERIRRYQVRGVLFLHVRRTL